jgi:hypothetical protein
VATATCTRYLARQTFVVLDAIPARRQPDRCARKRPFAREHCDLSASLEQARTRMGTIRATIGKSFLLLSCKCAVTRSSWHGQRAAHAT